MSLAALWLNRKAFRPTYSVIGFGSPVFDYGTLHVRPAAGFWYLLTAAAVFLVVGVVGVLQPVRPWWETGTTEETAAVTED